MNSNMSSKDTEKLVSDIVSLLPSLIDKYNIKPSDDWEQKLMNTLTEEGTAISRLTRSAIAMVVESEEWKEATKDIFTRLPQ